MSEKNYLHLQNGSDIRGVACEGIEGEPISLTPEAARYIGFAFAKMIADKTGKNISDVKISVGRDSRISGPMILKAFAEGVVFGGANVLDCGLSTTPAMFMSVIYEETACDGSCMCTASHLPFNRNGLKLFSKDGGFEKSDITTLLTLAASDEVVSELSDLKASYNLEASGNPLVSPAKYSVFNLIDLYSESLRRIIKDGVYSTDDFEHPLKGLHIVVDAGNGSGGFFASKVLEPLGADISGSQFLEPDGYFPNHIPNPENKEAMAAICRATVSSKADMGIIFDTDVDRMSAVFSDGSPINRDACIALASAIIAPSHKEATVVTDSVTSDRLTDFLENSLGLKHLPFKRGYKNVINKCKELNADNIDCPLAMETSGHGCMKENHYMDDGSYLAVKFITALAKNKNLPLLIKDFKMKFSDKEVRFKIKDNNFAAYGEKVLEAFKKEAVSKNYTLPVVFEGVRISFAKGSLSDAFKGGWIVLRASLHDPVMVLNMEAENDCDLKLIAGAVKDMLIPFKSLDISAL